MKKIVKVAFLSIMALLAFGVVLPSRVHADTNGSIFISKAGGTAEEDFPGVEGNPLGIASVFHIFAMQARLSAHTAGNLAVENLDGKVNFGTNISDGKLAKEVSYIQNITSIQNSSFVQSQGSRTNKIILGKNINVAYTDNGNHLAFNDTKMDHVKESEVYQDQGNEKYIDFEKEFEKLNVNSNTLAQTATSYTIKNSDFSDENNRVIDVSKMSPNENNKIIINLSSDILERDRPLIINGLSKEVNAPTVVFNVDGDGSNYNVGSQIKLRYSDGTERHNKETEDFSDAHILWNFENTKNGQVININAAFQGSILAPNAELNANQNVDGNLIAKTININSETHRWDLQNTTVSTSTTTTGTTEEPSTSSTTTTGTTEEPSTSNTTMTGTTEESSTSSTTMTGTTEEPSTSSTTTTDTTEEPSTSSTATTGTTEEPSTSSTTTTGTTEEPSTSNTTTTGTTEEPSTSNTTTTSITEEPSTSSTTTTGTTEEPSTSNTTTTGTTEESSTSNTTTTSITEEPSTSSTTTTSITEEPSTSSTTTTGTTEEPSTSSTTTTNTTKKPSTSATADTISNDLQKVTLVSSSKQTSSDKKINGTGNKNKSLPQTGEMSDKIASIVGIAFLIGAVVSLVILRKNKRTKD